MTEPSARPVLFSPARLAGLRRRAGDWSDRTMAEAAAVGLSYWATGRSPDGLDLAPGTRFADVLGWVAGGGGAPRGWDVGAAAPDGIRITVPAGVPTHEAQRALDDLADFPDRPVGTIGPSGVAERRAARAAGDRTPPPPGRPPRVGHIDAQTPRAP
ncbi:hypothetical protein ACFVZ3_05895, partial [Kitasatospora purpeofusca]|uniref:hypothetical protein n=1 Tax=Kitasatospora purpeofusca TaxID=67352 RepID=UPI0036B9FB6D